MFLDRRGQSVALAIAPNEEAGLHQIAQQLFSFCRAELPQSRGLGSGQAHAWHLAELGARTSSEIFSGSIWGGVDHRDVLQAEVLQKECHGPLTKLRRIRNEGKIPRDGVRRVMRTIAHLLPILDS